MGRARRRGVVAVVAALAVLCTPAVAGADTSTDVRTLIARAAYQWAAAQEADATFPNPVAAEVARGYRGFGPPMLLYGLYRTGQRYGNAQIAAQADRGWRVAVSPDRAGAFDMLAAAYTLRHLQLPAGTRAFLQDYIRRYVGYRPGACVAAASCYGNLKLVHAAAALAMTGTGVASTVPGTLLADPAAARRIATIVVNRTVPAVMRPLQALAGPLRLNGGVLSDPNDNPIAYHALSTFMLILATEELGAQTSASARLAVRHSLDALSVLMAPDGDVSYLGRGQGQVWVPALTAAALLKGARSLATTDPARAARYLAGAQQALQQLATIHQAPYGFLVVPGARTTVNGLDFYVNTLAYNGLTMFGLQVAADAAEGMPPLPAVPPPSHAPLRVHDPEGSGLGILATGQHWMAVNSRGRERRDLRYDFGLAGLRLRQADGSWRSLLAPRPLTGFPVGLSAGPTLRRGGRVGLPQSQRMRVGPAAIRIGGGYKRNNTFRWQRRRASMKYALIPGGVRLTVGGVRRKESYTFLVFTTPGTGRLVDRRTLQTAYGVWRFDRAVQVRRVNAPFHSGPVENLEGFSVRIPARHRERFALTITQL